MAEGPQEEMEVIAELTTCVAEPVWLGGPQGEVVVAGAVAVGAGSWNG